MPKIPQTSAFRQLFAALQFMGKKQSHGKAAILVACCRKHHDVKLSPTPAAALPYPNPVHPLPISMLGSDLSVTSPVYPQIKLQSRFLRFMK